MGRTTRSSYACARCYKRKKKCDRSYPSCSQCKNAKAQCIGLDRDSEEELPRSLVSYLEELVAQLELERESIAQERDRSGVGISQPDNAHTTVSHPLGATESTADVDAAYNLAAVAAKDSAPAASLKHAPRYVLPYYRAFFLGAELPFPLAFQEKRPMNVPCSHGGTLFTQLPDEVADKLMAVYMERILPQYPLFLKQDLSDMFQRFKMTVEGVETVTANEQFIIPMVMAIATLSSRAKDYRKLVSVAESLRRDAFTHLDFELSSNNATTTTIQQLLLLVQYGYLLPSSTNLWQVAGDATRIALELGLHQETPAESGLDEQAAEFRRRLYWTLYAMERSIAITSHRPLAVAGDQVHVPSSLIQDDPNFPLHILDHDSDQTFTQVSYIRFTDRLQFLRLQSEICSVNIGMRPPPNPQLTHDDWLVDMERRISEAKVAAATPKWCAFLEWHSTLLLHMPCAHNPTPSEDSVLKYFDAAVQMTNGYWELIESNSLDYPWHATHHCYEAGNLILYGLWHYRALLRRFYTTAQAFEVVHRISGFFILVVKQWPSAAQCGALFDRLRKGALSFFGEESSSDVEPCLEARQLKEFVFRENADVLYAREQPSAAIGPSTFEAMFPQFEIDHLSLDNDTDFLAFFNFGEVPDFDGFGQVPVGDEIEQLDASERPRADRTSSPTASDQQAKTVVDEAQLRAAMQKLPVCSHCKRRRIKCDMNLPACRNCTKLRRDCSYWDNALGEETSRRHVHALHQHAESLINKASGLCHSSELGTGPLDLIIGTMSSDLIRSRARPGGQPQRHVLSNILCKIPFSASSPPSMIFFGATSSFARVAHSLGSSITLPREATTPVPQPQTLLDTLCSSLHLSVSARISQAEAQNLAWHYYRCIETTHPILGQDLLSLTLNHVYSSSSETVGDQASQTRFNLVLAISMSLLSTQDQRFERFAEAYFREAISVGLSADQFIYPTHESLQMMLLLCVYAWIHPSAVDIWRLLGHASRMSLDIIEVHGSDKTDSAHAGVLYRTLYTLETQVSISFGRPHQLPDGNEVPAFSPDPGSMAAGELSAMVYSLARLQNRFHRDMIGSDGASREQELTDSSLNKTHWMATCVNDLRTWLDDWYSCVDALFDGSSVPLGEGDSRAPLRCYGEFQQCEALLLAKLATDRRGQLLITSEDELALCKQLLQAADTLRQLSTQSIGPSFPHALGYTFALVWTRMHAIFSATTVLLQHMDSTVPESEVHRLLRAGVDMLASPKHTGDWGTTGLLNCIKSMPNYTSI